MLGTRAVMNVEEKKSCKKDFLEEKKTFTDTARVSDLKSKPFFPRAHDLS